MGHIWEPMDFRNYTPAHSDAHNQGDFQTKEEVGPGGGKNKIRRGGKILMRFREIDILQHEVNANHGLDREDCRAREGSQRKGER